MKCFLVRLAAPLVFLLFLSCNSTGIAIPGEHERLSKNIASEYYQIAEGFMNVKNYEKAAEYYKKALRDKNVKLQAYYKMGRCYALAKNWDAAESIYKNLLKRDKENVDLRLSLAYIYAMGGYSDKAMGVYDELLEENPSDQIVVENRLSLKIALEMQEKEKYEKSKKKKPYEPSEKTLELKKEFETFKETFPDSAKITDYQTKFDELIPTSEEENVSKDGETAPSESASQ